ncbi:hypothetical protein ACFSTC_14675 [Nonomuraea ferruginea]
MRAATVPPAAEPALLGVAADVGPELLVVVVRARVAPFADAPLAPLAGADRLGLRFVDGAEVGAELGHLRLGGRELISGAGDRPLLLLGHLLQTFRRKRALPAIHRTHAQCHDDKHEEHNSDQAHYDRSHCTTLKAMACLRHR